MVLFELALWAKARVKLTAFNQQWYSDIMLPKVLMTDLHQKAYLVFYHLQKQIFFFKHISWLNMSTVRCFYSCIITIELWLNLLNSTHLKPEIMIGDLQYVVVRFSDILILCKIKFRHADPNQI